MYSKYLKRVLDFFISLTAIIVLSPVIILLTILLSIANSGKPFFFQKRPGKKERIFTIIKFKTMSDKKDKNGNLLPDTDRITRVGKFVRGASLDELLQLFNVLIGDMSIIGPRPLLVAYLPLYNQEQAKRHVVKPGITGWAQVNGRNAISWEEKFKLDVWYVKNISFSTDVKILLLTVKKVFQRADISSNENDTMPRFMGSPN